MPTPANPDQALCTSFPRDAFLGNAHSFAAVPMFLLITFVVVVNAIGLRLVLEIILIACFAAFWSYQTKNLWYEGVRADVG